MHQRTDRQSQASTEQSVGQSAEEARAHVALAQSVRTVELMRTHFDHAHFQIPFPFQLHLGKPESHDDTDLPAAPREVVQAVSELRERLEPERRAIARGEFTGEAFVRYVRALREGSVRYKGSGSYPDLIVDLLLGVERPIDVESGVRFTHHFSATPVGTVPPMVRVGEITNSDHVKDLGCGNGRLAALLHLATGCNASGVELLPRLAEQGQALMQRNKFSAVNITHGDALKTDLSDTTIVVMFAPFYAQMFQQMVTKFEERARQGAFRIVLHGPMEKYLEESKHFRTVPGSLSLRRFDSIYDSGEATAPDFNAATLPDGPRRRI